MVIEDQAVEGVEESTSAEETADSPAAGEEQIAEEQSSSEDTAGSATNSDESKPGQGNMIPRDRLNKEISKRREMEEELALLRAQNSVPQQTSQQGNDFSNLPPGIDPEVARGLDATLTALGYTKTEDAKRLTAQQVQELRRIQKEEQAINALSSKYDGTDGKPAFDAIDIESAVKEVLSDPTEFYEAVYAKQNLDALLDWAGKTAKKQTVSTPTKAKPGERKVGSDLETEIRKAEKTGSFTNVIKTKLFGQEDI